MNIDFLVGDNAYQTTTHFARCLARGLNARLVHTDDFQSVLQNPPDLTCSFSEIHVGDRPLSSMWHIPHLMLAIDPAIYFLTQATHFTCVDREDVIFLQKKGKKALFLPHGVDPSVSTPHSKPRFIPILFLGSCIDYEQVQSAWKRFEPHIEEQLRHISSQVLSSHGKSTLAYLQEADLLDYHNEIDLYTRGRDRIELLKRFPEAHIYGSGPWRKYLPNAHIHDPVDFPTAITLMQQAKIVLNSSIRFKHGSHERIFYALACGALPLTGKSSYIQEILPDLPTYEYGSWETTLPQNTSEIIEAGQKEVLENHTWQCRSEMLLNIFARGISINPR